MNAIIKDFVENYKNLLQIQFPISDNFQKIICNSHNKKIFEQFCVKYPSFFQKINEMIYIYDKSVDEIIKEKTCYCGNVKYLKNYNHGYRKYCSVKCMSLSEEVQNKKKKTTNNNYGVDNPAQSKHIQSKMKSTILKKYGVEHQMLCDDVKRKVKDTNIEKYGHVCTLHNEDIRERVKQTILEKYGCENVLASDQIKQKIKETNIEKYGVEYSILSPIVQEKIQRTNREKYGVDNNKQHHLKNLEHLNETYIREHFIKDGYFIIDEFCDFYNCSITFSVVKRKEFNITEKVKTNRHKTQNKIFEWLNSLGFNPINKDRQFLTSRKELDIFLPDHKLAIEYNGIMFHSFGKSDYSMFNNEHEESERKYEHINKTEECEKQDIQLLQIFEDEWINKQYLWKSMILNKLGLSEKIYGRKCEIREIDNDTKRQFLEFNHLQGDDKSSIRLGLFHNNELVSVMTFGKSRYNKHYQYELLRFCSKQNTVITGGASKLFKYFIKKYQPKSVISYANRRWSDGNVYRKIGFKEINRTEPNYFYFDKSLILKSRIQFQKHKLKTLPFYDDNLTETEIMYLNNYRKIYDCGNIVFAFETVNNSNNTVSKGS